MESDPEATVGPSAQSPERDAAASEQGEQSASDNGFDVVEDGVAEQDAVTASEAGLPSSRSQSTVATALSATMGGDAVPTHDALVQGMDVMTSYILALEAELENCSVELPTVGERLHYMRRAYEGELANIQYDPPETARTNDTNDQKPATRPIVLDARGVNAIGLTEQDLETMLSENNELSSTIGGLLEREKKLTREVAWRNEFIQEYAKKGQKQSAELKKIQTKMEDLEKDLERERHKHKKSVEKWAVQRRRDNDQYEKEIERLRSALEQRTQELRVIRKAARTVLKQRSDVEQFFLDSLEVVKSEIASEQRKEKAREARVRAVKEWRANASKGDTSHVHGKLPTDDVDIGALGWQERERVLRLLFRKMNSSGSSKGNVSSRSMPSKPHTLSTSAAL